MTTLAKETRTALVVDDDPAILEVLAAILDNDGFATTGVGYAQAALDLLEQRRFDLLLIDLGLPDMSGMVICDAARQRYGDDVVILIVTADNRPDRLVTALQLGADDLVPKPFSIDELLMRIEVKLRRAHNHAD